METVLRCDKLKKSYRDGSNEVTVLQEVNFAVQPAQTVAIIGASGCGKSTLLHLLGGLDQPTEGEVLWQEQTVGKMSERMRCRLRNRHIGFVYQFHHLLPEFTALENVAMPLLIRGDKPTQAETAAAELLSQVGLAQRVQHKVNTLSGGERQRVALARALVTSPAVLLADEPTGNLDRQTAEQMLMVMLDLQRQFKTALVVVTHDSELAGQLQCCYRLANGQLQQSNG